MLKSSPHDASIASTLTVFPLGNDVLLAALLRIATARVSFLNLRTLPSILLCHFLRHRLILFVSARSLTWKVSSLRVYSQSRGLAPRLAYAEF